jgi:hypothetical protein
MPERGVDEDPAALGSDPVVLPPCPGPDGRRPDRDAGGQVHHGVVPGHGPAQRVRVEQARLHRRAPWRASSPAFPTERASQVT